MTGRSRGLRMELAPDSLQPDDALPFTIALGAAAYLSGFATEGYEPHKL